MHRSSRGAVAAQVTGFVELDREFCGTSDNAATLVCPRCRFQYLHQTLVAVFNRAKEDAPTTEIVVNGASVEFEAGSTRNPSGRRQGLAISFDCENCGPVGELTIRQHKGVTLLAWRVAP